MTAVSKDRVLRWIFPSAASIVTALAMLASHASGAGAAEEKANAVASKVADMDVARKADHDILLRIDERVKQLTDEKGGLATLALEIRALRATMEKSR